MKKYKNAPWVSLLDESAKIVTSRLGPDRLRVAGTVLSLMVIIEIFEPTVFNLW